MKVERIVLFLVLISVCLTEEKKEKEENLLEYNGRVSNVIELTNLTMNEFKQKGNALIFYYIPTCRLCSQIGQMLDKTSILLAEEGTEVSIGRFNVREYLLNKQEEKENTAPAMYFYDMNGVKQVIDGSYYKTREMTNRLQVLSAQWPRYIGYVDIQHYRYKTEKLFYIHVGEVSQHVQQVFAHVHQIDKMLVCTHIYHKHETGSLIAIRKFEGESDMEEVVCLKETCKDKESVELFVRQTWAPLLMDLDKTALSYLMGQQGKAVVLFVDEEKDFVSMSAIKSASKQIRQMGLLVLKTQTVRGEGRKLATFLDIGLNMPQLLIIDNDGQYANDIKKYVMRERMSVSGIVNWVAKFQRGQLRQEIESQQETVIEERGVKVFVGSNLRKELFSRQDRDTLLLIYAQHSGLCKVLMPEYEKVAKALQGFHGLQVAKIEGDKNDLEGISYYGFPSVKFIKGSTQTDQEFDEDFHIDGFLKFLGDNVEGLNQFLQDKKEENIKQEL